MEKYQVQGSLSGDDLYSGKPTSNLVPISSNIVQTDEDDLYKSTVSNTLSSYTTSIDNNSSDSDLYNVRPSKLESFMIASTPIEDDEYKSTVSKSFGPDTAGLSSFLASNSTIADDDLYKTGNNTPANDDLYNNVPATNIPVKSPRKKNIRTSISDRVISLSRPLSDSLDTNGEFAEDFERYLATRNLARDEIKQQMAKYIQAQQIEVHGCSKQFAYNALAKLSGGASSSVKLLTCLEPKKVDAIQDCDEQNVAVIKVIPVHDASNPSDPGNVERHMVELLSTSVVRTLTPHVTELLAAFKCTGKVLADLTGIQKLRDPEHASVQVVLVHRAKTDLGTLLRNSSASNAEYFDGLRKFIFQSIFTMDVILRHLPGFRHNDFHPGNILIESEQIPTIYAGDKYTLETSASERQQFLVTWPKKEDEKTYEALRCKIWDFEYASSIGKFEYQYVKNDNQDSQVGKRIGASNIACPAHDVHTLLNFLYLDELRDPYIPSDRRECPEWQEFKQFVERLYRPTFLVRNSEENSDDSFGPYVSAGRLTANVQKRWKDFGLPTPVDILKDRYFASLVLSNPEDAPVTKNWGNYVWHPQQEYRQTINDYTTYP